MDIFPKKKSYLGVDLGTSTIKIVQLQGKGGRAVLVTYGYVEQPTDVIRSSSKEMEERIVDIIKAIYKKSRMSSKHVIAALPSFSVFSSIINLPVMGKKDLGQAVRWEAKKFIPLPIEEMTLDWKVIPGAIKVKVKKESAKEIDKQKKDKPGSEIGDKQAEQAALSGDTDKPEKVVDKDQSLVSETKPSEEEEGEKKSLLKLFGGKKNKKDKLAKRHDQAKDQKNIKVLVTAAPKNLVEKYIRIFKTADLDLLRLETEPFALERSLVSGDPASVMIIDIGAVSSDISIIEKNMPILTRSIDVGGTAITKAVMTSLNVDLARAEQFKRDIGFSMSGPGDLPDVIKSAIDPIINEIKYCLDIYFSQADQHKSLEKIILTGGSAFLPELVNYLAKLLDIKVIIGDPWDKVVYPLELRPVLAELGPRFAVAIGLAMREI